MENASKALIMAAGVLIALMIIGALILMFNGLSNYQGTDTQTTREAQIVAFNAQFDGYNKQDLRGNELYSVLNRAIDYNERKTKDTEGGEGLDIQFEEMEINFDIIAANIADPNGENNLYKKNKYNLNEFRNDILPKIKDIENSYGTGALTKLTTNITKIFIDEQNPSEDKQKELISLYKSSGTTQRDISWNDIKPGGKVREDIYKYYEHVEFKRLHFKCIGIEYNQKTGRIVKMDFEYKDKKG